jgi:hypothetical protein
MMEERDDRLIVTRHMPQETIKVADFAAFNKIFA